MGFPYQRLHVSGDVLIAAKGASIHSFSLLDGSLVHSWTHPRFEPASEDVNAVSEAMDILSSVISSPDPATGGTPPVKRRKLETETSAEKNDEGDVAINGSEQGTKESSRKRRKHKLAAQPKSPDIALVICLTGSSNGEHIAAVTSTDKTLWVFEHDGKGHFKQLRQRIMPKRPSTIAITADDKTVVSGDKFGDVYALPLVPSQAAVIASVTDATATPPPLSKPRGPQANELTVHSQRNLKALEAQRRTLEEKLRRQKLDPDSEQPAQAEADDITLLLGHVSLLTDLVLASSPVPSKKPRDYLITADRDEHIRVSRGIPQAHVIENFCLGHEGFVSRLCLLPRPDASGRTVLVSGGGDGSLLVWDWCEGRLLHEVPLHEHVGEAKLAVSGLLGVQYSRLSSEGEDERHLFVLCERISTVFIFRLNADANLVFLQSVQLPGNSMDMAAAERQDALARVIISIMPPQAESESPGLRKASGLLVSLEASLDGGWSLIESDVVDTASMGGEENLPRDEMEKLLFTLESLRKTDVEDANGLMS